MESPENQISSPRNKFYNVYTILSFAVGVLVCSILFAIFHFITDFSANNFIEFFSILINIAVGFIVYLIIEKKAGDDRVVKDIFQQELKDIKSYYKNFLIKLNKGECQSQEITNWFKLMSINITQFEFFLEQEFLFKKEECTLQKMNRKIQMVLTDAQEFNENFNKGKISFSSETKSKIIELNKELKHNFTRTAVKISRA